MARLATCTRAYELRGKAHSVFQEFYFLTGTAPRPFRFRGHRFRAAAFPRKFVRTDKERFGVETCDRAGLDVAVTGLERTLVDLFDRPDLGGGPEEVWRSLPTVEFFDLQAVTEYAALLGNATTVAKVGFFLEAHRERLMVSDVHLARLRRRRPRQPHYFEKRDAGKGRLVAGWNLVVPDSVMSRCGRSRHEALARTAAAGGDGHGVPRRDPRKGRPAPRSPLRGRKSDHKGAQSHQINRRMSTLGSTTYLTTTTPILPQQRKSAGCFSYPPGAMSYAQFHYPFENRELFENRFPADYICEAIDQTRGWFYSLHAIGALVSDSVAYRNCICLAHIVDKDGKKMSKSQGNIVNPYDVFDHVGADPLRWYLACRIAPEVQKRISVDFVRGVASGFINTWWNTYAFFVMYAKLDRIDVSDDVPLAERPEIDRWALALLHRTVTDVTNALEAYDVFKAGRAIESFVDQLSNWYVRRNRRRFWKAAAGRDKQAAYLTLYECLHTANRLMAPIMPFITEVVHQNLVRGADETACLSVHMSEWPTPDSAAHDDILITEIDVVQRVVGLGRAARNSSGVRVRQPLSRLLVRTPDEASAAFVARHEAQILEELNVKAVEMLAPDAELLTHRIKPNLPRIGKRFGKRVPAIREALGAADSSAIAAAVAAGRTFDVEAGGETIAFEPEDVLVESTSAEGYACAEEGGFLVGLDTALTEALEREGLARELVHTVQEARKQAGLDVSDRITLRIEGTPEVAAALDAHREYVMEETLATRWGDVCWSPAYSVEHTLGDGRWTIGLARIDGR